MVARLAADVGRPRVAGKRAHGTGPPKKLDSAVDGGEAELRLAPARRLEEIDCREAPVAIRDEVEDGSALRGESSPARQGQAAVFGAALGARRCWTGSTHRGSQR